MTISTPQPEYIDDTQQVVEDALSEETTVGIKLVPTSEDWLEAHADAFFIECPVCHSYVRKVKVDEHTSWHQQMLDVFLILGS